MGYSAWGCKELDMTATSSERLHVAPSPGVTEYGGGFSAMCRSDITYSHPVSSLPPPKLPTLQSCCRVTQQPSVPNPERSSLLGGRWRYQPGPTAGSSL